MRYIMLCLCVLFSGCATNDTQYFKKDAFVLRFVDHSKLNPLSSLQLPLKPRRSVIKIDNPSQDEPNKESIQLFRTDAEGFLIIPKSKIDELTSNGAIYVDCWPEGYTRFVLERDRSNEDDWPPVRYKVTVFDRSNGVAYTIYLSEKHDNILLLEKEP